MFRSSENVLIETQKLLVKYRYVVALNDVSLKIPYGKALIVGSNGSGKTTLLKVIAGLIIPTRGWVRVFGLDPVRNFNEMTRRILFVRDSDDVHQYFKVKSLVNVFSKIYGERKTLEAVDRLGLLPHMEKRICELSKGFRRRIALLESLIAEKELIMLDEPLSGLDYESRNIIRNTLAEFLVGKSIIVSSHIPLNLDFNYLIVLEQGRVVYSGEYSHEIALKYFRLDY